MTMTREDRLLLPVIVFSMEHHANSLAVNSMLLSPGTNNLIAMKKRRVDRTGYSEDVETWGLDKKVRCRSRLDLKDRNER